MSTSGDEAIELAATAGLILDPWQRAILRHSLGERADGKWSAFEVALIVSRQNGKGSVLEARELFGLILGGERLIMHTAHELKTAMEHKRRMEALFDYSDDLRKRVKKISNANGDEGIEFRNGSRLRFVARSRGSGRGFSGDLVVLDEAYALTTDQVGALVPTMSARPNPQIWYTTSPPLDPVTGAQIMSVRRRGVKTVARDRGRLAYFDFGADGTLDDLRGIDLDDRALRAATNPAYGHRVSEEFVENERALMDDESFARERLGVWPRDIGDGGWKVISEPDWTAALDAGSQIDGALAFGVAVSRDRRRAAIAVAGRRADGEVHIELVDMRPGTPWVLDRLDELIRQHRPCGVGVDKFGAGGTLIDAAAERRIDSIVPLSTGDVARAFGRIYDGLAGDDLDARDVHHIGQDEMTQAVAQGSKRALGDGWAWDQRDDAGDITPIVAATNALHVLVTRGNVPVVTPWVMYA